MHNDADKMAELASKNEYLTSHIKNEHFKMVAIAEVYRVNPGLFENLLEKMDELVSINEYLSSRLKVEHFKMITVTEVSRLYPDTIKDMLYATDMDDKWWLDGAQMCLADWVERVKTVRGV